MASPADLLQKIDLFEQLDSRIINKIADVCVDREYSAGDYVIRQGETGLGLFLITNGRVKVEIESDGTKTVVAELKDEEFFGELSIIDNRPRSANVICVTDTRCLLLTRDSFSKLMAKYPEIAVAMAKALADRLRKTTAEKVSHSTAIESSSLATAGPASAADRSAGTSVATPPPALPEAATAAPPPPTANGSSTKNKVRDFLVDTFNRLYTMKAMTRFSVALVGCPVQIAVENAGPEVLCGDVDDVKFVIFPASRERIVKINGESDGAFSVTVLRPAPEAAAGVSAFHFKGQIARHDRLRLHVPDDEHLPVWLER